MRRFRLLKIACSILFLAMANAVHAQDLQTEKPGEQASNDIQMDFIPYLQSGSSATQLASAVAFLETCAIPLTFEESREESRWTLTVTCGEADNPAGVDLEFRTHDGSGAYPFLEPLSFTAFP